MSEIQKKDTVIKLDVKEVENVDSDKSFESCVNSVTDGINNFTIKDDDSEKSFESCPLHVPDQISSINNEDVLHTTEASLNSKNVIEEDDDDDIRPGSCRELPSSDDEISLWDENNDNWIYDSEYVALAENGPELPESDVIDDKLKLCEKDLEYIIENHVSKDVINKEKFDTKNKKEVFYKNRKITANPTSIPTNGQFYMHDMRSKVKEDQHKGKSNKNIKTKSIDNWAHDLYDEDKQKPISKMELINKYGADIRSKDINENKSKPLPRYGNNFKRPNYRYHQQPYYDYGYYDSYDQYYYDNNDYYYDDYYAYEMDPWSRSNRNTYDNSRETTVRNNHIVKHDRNYKTNTLPVDKKNKKSQKPPSKYSQIAEYTDIKITVNLDNTGTRQIKNVSNSNKKHFNVSKTYENSNYRRRGGENYSSNFSGKIKDDFNKVYMEPQYGNPSSKPGYHQESTRNNSHQKPPTDNQLTGFLAQKRDSKHTNPLEKNFGEIHGFNRDRDVPDWVNTKFEWDQNAEFKDVIEEMPPLSEKEINQIQKRPNNINNAPPRFSRDKSASHAIGDMKTQNRVQSSSFVPKRYSELRNQSEPSNTVTPSESTTVPSTLPVTNPPELLNYPQMVDYYNNLQPLLINMTQGPSHAASNSSSQQSSNNFPSIQPQMMSISSLLQPGSYTENQPIYFQQLYLPQAGRINHYTPFQPSYVSPGPMFPTPTPMSPPNNNTPNTPQNCRPVLGRS